MKFYAINAKPGNFLQDLLARGVDRAVFKGWVSGFKPLRGSEMLGILLRLFLRLISFSVISNMGSILQPILMIKTVTCIAHKRLKVKEVKRCVLTAAYYKCIKMRLQQRLRPGPR